MLKVLNISKSFASESQTVQAVHGVSFEISTGESVALMGVSGAGKSTLLRIIGGLETPTAGDVQVDGESLYGPNTLDLDTYRLRSVGFVFQFHYLIEELSALENVMLPLRIQRVDVVSAEQSAREMLRRVGLEHRMHHRPAELSGGEQQRVSIARALVHSPSLVLADEPTGNLDETTGNMIGDLLVEFCREQGTKLLTVTHNEALAEKMDRKIVMRSGELQGERGD